MKQSQVYFGLFKKKEEVAMIMGDMLPQRAEVEFAYKIGHWQGSGATKAYIERVMVFYSLDKRVYAFNGMRQGGDWQCQILPKIEAQRSLDTIPEYVANGEMSETWARFYEEVYRRMLALEELFDQSRIDDSPIDRSNLPKILRSLPGFGAEKPGVN